MTPAQTLLILAPALPAIAAADPSDLTMWLLHSPDKSEHLAWAQVQPTVDSPFDTAALLQGAARWTGPVYGPSPYFFGNVASQYLEAELHLNELFARAHYDYVVVLSDHSMTRQAAGAFPGQHLTPPAYQGVFAIAGPGVRSGQDLGTISALDVAPTVAYLLGLPVAQDLPGRLVVEAFTPEHVAANPIWRVPTWGS
jgi:hypothetical protein